MGDTAAFHGRRSANERPPLTWADRRFVLRLYAMGIVGAAVFPRLAYWARWPTRASLRGRIAYAALNALLLFAIRQYVMPSVKRIVEEHERTRDQLRRQLGREPTERELIEHSRTRV